jgi:sugar phosphate isomerase/epimerase
MNLSRRSFLKTSGSSLVSAAILSQVPLSLFGCGNMMGKQSFGFQIWTIREKLIADFPGTLKMMADLGYKEVEMCSPLGYGFDSLHEIKGPDMRKIIEDSGLKCTSSHYNVGELRDHLDNRIQWAHDLGMKQIILSSFWLPEEASMDDYKKAADELNSIGEKTKKAGIQMGFHNHHMEFEKRGDELIYDVILDQLDPELVKMQFQVAVVNIGYKAADYFNKYPGRFISAHLSDWVNEDKSVPIGKGMVDWPAFFEAAKTGGVENFYAEINPEFFEESIKNLLDLS